MSKYDCPHCGKFNLRTFCEHCGKPTETLLKYRVFFSIGLILIPLVTVGIYFEIQRLLPEIEETYGNYIGIILVPIILIGLFSVPFILYQWICKELEFRDYYMKNPGVIV